MGKIRIPHEKGVIILKRRNKKVLKTVKILILCVLLLALASFAKNGSEAGNETGGEVAINSEYSFKISDFDGRIAVFDLKSDEMIEVFDVYLSSLPYDEQNEIKNGIFAENRQELQRIIEDFTS